MPLFAMLLVAAAAQVDESPAGAGEPAPVGRMAVVGIGRCDEARLGQAVRALRAELRLQRGADVLSEDETADPAGGLQRTTLEESEQTIDAARGRFFGLDYGSAEAMLRKVLAEIDRLPPGQERWEVAARARVELAHVSVFNLKRGLAGEMLFDVLRLQEDLTLDRHRYPPMLRDELERARRLVQRSRRFTLRVQSPSTYPVFLNGREVGRTPFERGLVEGEYEVVVGDPWAHSFPRRVELRSDREVQMEVLPEARYRAMAGPCFDADPTLEERRVAAALVAGALAVEHVVLVRLEKSGSEELVIAALVPAGGGPEAREGRQRAEGGALPRLKNLATYVLTGDASVLEERLPERALPDPSRAPSAAPRKRSRRVREAPPVAPAAPVAAVGPVAATVAREAPSAEGTRAAQAPFPWMRAGGIAMGVAAVGLGVAALVEAEQMSRAGGEVARLVSTPPRGMSRELAGTLASRIAEFEAAKGLRNAFAAGAVAAGVASGGLLYLSVVPRRVEGGAGAVVTVAGRF